MALTATTPRNAFVSNTYDGQVSPLPIVTTEIINQGDLLVWDATLNAGNGAARTPVTQADMAEYVGVADGTNPVTSLGDKLNNIPFIKQARIKFKTTPADVYTHFQKVFFNETLDVQTITNNTNTGARTVAVGFVCLPQELLINGTTSLTGAAGVMIEVFITPNFPAASF